MLGQTQDKQNKQIAVRVTERLDAYLLLELAGSCGLDAWPDDELAGIVWLRCEQKEVEELLESARPAAKLLRMRGLEALMEAVTLAGGKTSQNLREAVEQTQGAWLGCKFADAPDDRDVVAEAESEQ